MAMTRYVTTNAEIETRWGAMIDAALKCRVRVAPERARRRYRYMPVYRIGDEYVVVHQGKPVRLCATTIHFSDGSRPCVTDLRFASLFD